MSVVIVLTFDLQKLRRKMLTSDWRRKKISQKKFFISFLRSFSHSHPLFWLSLLFSKIHLSLSLSFSFFLSFFSLSLNLSCSMVFLSLFFHSWYLILSFFTIHFLLYSTCICVSISLVLNYLTLSPSLLFSPKTKVIRHTNKWSPISI